MHEHGLIEKLLRSALAEAASRGATLRCVRVRLGALWGATAEHFREDFEAVRESLGAGSVALELVVEPDRPSGVELLSIECGR